MRVRAIFRVLFYLYWSFILASSMRPQSADLGSLEGIVTDPSGGVVPGVALIAKDQHRSTTFVASTNRDGLYHFSILPVGTYDLAAEHPGFVTWLQKGIEVTIGAQISINLTLRLAGTSESVVVQDPGLTIETTRSQFSSTVDSSSVSSLPANGR